MQKGGKFGVRVCFIGFFLKKCKKLGDGDLKKFKFQVDENIFLLIF